MKYLPVLIFLILILLLTGVSAALELSEITVTSDSEWITAGGDPATITVGITNLSSTVSSVEFSCTDSATYGSPDSLSDSTAPYTTTFSPTKSGEAVIEAEVIYTEDEVEYSLSKTVVVNIDHSEPDSISDLDYNYEAEVGSAIEITVIMEDVYGNTIDNLRETAEGGVAEQVIFTCTGEPSGFWNGVDYSQASVTKNVGTDGLVTAEFLVSTTPGENLVNIESPEPVSQKIITINGISTAEPVSIESAVNPYVADPPYVPADGKTPFTITYFLYDEYGNPSGNRTVLVSSSDPTEDDFSVVSNSKGQIMVTYGPKSQKGLFTLTATSTDNSSVTISDDLLFESTEPVDMLLTANPETMPSADVSADFTATIRAKVIDERGNPVKNENVTFSLESKTYPAYQITDPQLLETYAETDVNGQAIVEFKPGEFETDWSSPDFEKTADANCTITSQWTNVSRTIQVEWKNYPYISVQTAVSPETVAVNGTVDATITLSGDGWALMPDPIDVMVSVDRSGSMLRDYPDRMVSVMSALKTFNSEMSEDRDQVGISSFGVSGSANIYYYGYDYWSGSDYTYYDDSSYISSHYFGNGKYYSDYATTDLELTTDHSNFEYEVDRIVPMSGTPMRKGLYLAIKELVDNGREDAVKAVILLSDGDYNYYGDPLARGYAGYYYYYGHKYYYSSPTSYSTLTENYYPFSDLSSEEQNLTVYANNHNITVYSIAFSSGISSGGKSVLEAIADNTGGNYYYAPTGSDLLDIYTAIAGELKTEAGVDTTMQLVFDNLELNNVSVANTAEDPVMDYVYLEGVSTTVESWNAENDVVIPLTTNDDTADWNDDFCLDFDIGTIRLGQVWETNFRLQILKSGNLNIFGSGSTISFNNGTDTLNLPDTYVTAVADFDTTGISSEELDVKELSVTSGDIVTDRFDLGWKVNYSGSKVVTHEISYIQENGVIVPYKTLGGLSGPLDDYVMSETINVFGIPSGNYEFKVSASVIDAADDIEAVPVAIGVSGDTVSYIKIE